MSDTIAGIQIASQWLGWAQRYEKEGRYLWKLHEPRQLWAQIRDAITATDGEEAAKPISDLAKAQTADDRYRCLLNAMSDEALLKLQEAMESLRAEQPLPALLPNLEEEMLDAESVAEFVALAQAGDDESLDMFGALLEELPANQQNQILEATATAENAPEPNQETQEQALPPQVVPEVTQPKAEPLPEHPSPKGCFPVNLNIEPQWLHHSSKGMVYAGRYNKRLRLKQSPLHNPIRMRKESDRPQVIAQHTEQVVIPELQRGYGPRWDEWQRLIGKVKQGESVALGCFCAPRACHCDAHSLVINGLATGKDTQEIIEGLKASLPAKQTSLLGVQP